MPEDRPDRRLCWVAHSLNVAMSRDLAVALDTPRGRVVGYPVLKLRERAGLVFGLAAEPRGAPAQTVALEAIEGLSRA